MVICPFAPYGLAHGQKTCQISDNLGPDFVERISLKPLDGLTPWTCSCATSLLFAHLPHMGFTMGEKLVKSDSTRARRCVTHISESVEWIYTIQSSMELSRPVIVQHHGHLTLTLDSQGHILKILYLRNGRADWHGAKGMWVYRMLDPHCDFELWPHPWPRPLIFKLNLEKSLLRHGMTDWHGTKGMWVDRMLDSHCDSELDLTHDLDLWFSRSIFEIVVSQEQEGRFTWN